ncbi:hypothetical protein C8R44DRAFT_872291 [Mycena epipterygia]|nr:hypothetical protein C8R44DRAFT_872291 [Mycena epipterygia]
MSSTSPQLSRPSTSITRTSPPSPQCSFVTACAQSPPRLRCSPSRLRALAPPHHPPVFAPPVTPHRLPPCALVSLRAPSVPAAGPPSYPTHALAIAPAGKDVGGPYAILPVHAVVLAARRLPAPAPARPRALAFLGVAARAPAPAPLPAGVRHPPRLHVHPLPRPRLCRPPSLPARVPRFSGAALERAGRRACRHPLRPRLQHRAPHPRHLHGASVGNLTALMGHADHAKELWQDMVALGLYYLWDALDLAWEVVVGRLNLAAAQ